MKRTTLLILSSALFLGCPGPAEEVDSGIDASIPIDTGRVLRDAPPRADTFVPSDAFAAPDAAADSPLPCGALSAICCEGDLCDEGGCTMGRCEVEGCGTASAPCCVAGAACGAGLSCTGGICDNTSCGAPGQTCCGGECDDSSDRYLCLSGSCFDCGELGESCCGAGAPSCFGALACNGGTCQTPICGMPGMACCAGNTCMGSLECVRGEFNLCTDTSACGHVGQACCEVGAGCVGTAPPGLECRFGTCGACGAAGQPCCTTGPGVVERCATGLTCGGGGVCG